MGVSRRWTARGAAALIAGAGTARVGWRGNRAGCRARESRGLIEPAGRGIGDGNPFRKGCKA